MRSAGRQAPELQSARHAPPRSPGWAVLASLAIAACGEGTSDSGLGLRFSDAATLARASEVAVAFYADDEGADQCTRLRATRPREKPALGPFRQVLDDGTRMNGTTLPLTLPAGTWAVLVDATAGDGSLVGSGCAQDQVVRAEERSSITLIVDPAQ